MKMKNFCFSSSVDYFTRHTLCILSSSDILIALFLDCGSFYEIDKCDVIQTCVIITLIHTKRIFLHVLFAKNENDTKINKI